MYLFTHRRLKVLVLLGCSLLAATLPHAARAQAPPSLESLSADFAMRFLEPEAHMALAKYFRDSGDPVAAFDLLEAARRGRFPPEVFDPAFKTYFLGEKSFASDKETEAKLLAQLAREPDSREALFGLADIYISREDWPKAKRYLRKLIEAEPTRFEHVEALAEVYRRAGDAQQAELLPRQWARAHPETAEGYRIRVGELSETETDRAKALLKEAAAKFPDDPHFPFDLAGINLREKNLKEAERLYVRAAELAPDSAYIQAWVGRFFFKAAPDDRRALEHYLKAYLLDPHAYESEYVESRISTLLWRAAEARLSEQLKRGVPPSKLVEDQNHYVAGLAIAELAKSWRPAYVKTLVGLLAHRDVGVRWAATQLLKEKADASFDPTLRALLQDKDPIVRGLAAYIAVRRWKAASFDLMRQMLREESQLLRFDAVSALIMEGGPAGRKIVFEHAAHEPHPRLRGLIEAAQKAGPPEPEP